jgi:hypothetical protein
LLAIVAAAVALNVAVVAPAATTTDAGTVSEALLLASVMLDPPAGAAWVNVTVHLLVAPPLSDVGEQVTGDSEGTVIIPLPADVTLRPFPFESTPTRFDI